ncbi:MAG: hypothetical protein IPJ65_04890 [Archangiaceae bacterium]|nr:hypothetical protein [Archangiaceae bacterium]
MKMAFTAPPHSPPSTTPSSFSRSHTCSTSCDVTSVNEPEVTTGKNLWVWSGRVPGASPSPGRSYRKQGTRSFSASASLTKVARPP